MTRTLKIAAVAIAMLMTDFAHAQINASFEPVNDGSPFTSMTASCWQFNNILWDDQSFLTGTGSAYITPPTNGSIAGSIHSPFLNFTGAAVNVSFQYRIDKRLSTNASRAIIVGTLTATNVFIPLHTINLDQDNSTVNAVNYSGSFIIPAGIARMASQLTGSQDGNTFLLIDQISIGAALNGNGCSSGGTMTAPLPLKLTQFNSLVQNGKAVIKWTVDENETGDRFELERSRDGRFFSTAAMIFTSETAGIAHYSHQENLASGVMYYRLRLVNKDGTRTLSAIIRLSNGAETSHGIRILTNPVINDLQADITASKEGLYTIRIYSMNGVQVLTANRSLQPGSNLVRIALNTTLIKGAYLLEISNGSDRATAKFIR